MSGREEQRCPGRATDGQEQSHGRSQAGPHPAAPAATAAPSPPGDHASSPRAVFQHPGPLTVRAQVFFYEKFKLCPKHSVFPSFIISCCFTQKPRPNPQLIRSHSSKASAALGSASTGLPPAPRLPAPTRSKEHDAVPTRVQPVHKGWQLVLYCSVLTLVANNI